MSRESPKAAGLACSARGCFFRDPDHTSESNRRLSLETANFHDDALQWLT